MVGEGNRFQGFECGARGDILGERLKSLKIG